MGKRKRRGSSGAVYHPSPSDSMPCSSGRDLTPGENSSDPDNSGILKPHLSVKEIMDSHGKQPVSQLALGQHHHHNLSRSMLLKRSRHHYGNQYARRNSSNYHKSSTFSKSSPFHDERLCFQLGNKYNSDLGLHPDFTEFRERAFWRPERIRSSSSVIHAFSSGGVRNVCGICQKSLRRKPHRFGTTLVSGELSIVAAVLVCGHIFHADCLEQRTCLEDKRDPPCPICSGSIPNAEVT